MCNFWLRDFLSILNIVNYLVHLSYYTSMKKLVPYTEYSYYYNLYITTMEMVFHQCNLRRFWHNSHRAPHFIILAVCCHRRRFFPWNQFHEKFCEIFREINFTKNFVKLVSRKFPYVLKLLKCLALIILCDVSSPLRKTKTQSSPFYINTKIII